MRQFVQLINLNKKGETKMCAIKLVKVFSFVIALTLGLLAGSVRSQVEGACPPGGDGTPRCPEAIIDSTRQADFPDSSVVIAYSGYSGGGSQNSGNAPSAQATAEQQRKAKCAQNKILRDEKSCSSKASGPPDSPELLVPPISAPVYSTKMTFINAVVGFATETFNSPYGLDSAIISRGVGACLNSCGNDNQCVSDVKKYFGQTLLNTPATNVPFIGDLTAWINWAKNWVSPATFQGSAAATMAKNYEYGAACVALKAEQIANSCQQ